MPDPFVSVFMVTYNHEKFIGEAIESVLAQRTSYPIKLFIGEDHSTDGTREICINYKNKNPEKIELLLNSTNIGALNNARRVYRECFSSRSKYIAMLEGDDSWIDPFKIQKQVEILEQNPYCSGCITNAEYVNYLTGTNRLYFTNYVEGLIDPHYIILKGGGSFPTPSLMFRNDPQIFDSLSAIPELSGDELLIYVLTLKGGIFFLNQVTCVYNRWSGGLYSSISNSSALNSDLKERFIRGYKKFDSFSKGKFHRQLLRKISIDSLFIIRNSSGFRKYKYLKNLNWKEIVKLIIGARL